MVYAEEERKGVTADIEVVDGPNEEGEAFACPGKLCDPFRRSHHIERAAKTCNSDLSFIKMVMLLTICISSYNFFVFVSSPVIANSTFSGTT